MMEGGRLFRDAPMFLNQTERKSIFLASILLHGVLLVEKGLRQDLWAR